MDPDYKGPKMDSRDVMKNRWHRHYIWGLPRMSRLENLRNFHKR